MTDKNNDLDIPIYEIKSSETIRKSMIKSDNSTTTTINAAPAFNSPILHSPTDISTLTADPPSSILLSEPLRRVKSLSPVRVVSIKTPGVINQISSKISSLINTSAPDIPNSTPELTPLTAIIDKSPKIMNQNDIDIVKRKARMNASIIRKQEQDYVQRPVKNTKFKNFKEWHAPFLAESKQYIDVIKKSRLEDRELGEFITLSDLFGDYKNPFSASAYMIWAARNLEKLKTDVTWNIKRSAPVFIRGKKVIKTGNDDDSDDDDDIKYRLLNIFEDKRIERVVYSWNESGHDIVQNGRPLDLIDAMIFPLVQDYEFPKVFLSSFRMYIPARRVVEALIEWYNVDIDDSANTVEEQFLKKNKRSIQCRVIRILVLWINSYWQDFVGDNSLYCELMRFVIDAAAVSFGDAEKLSQSIREQRLTWYTVLYIQPFPQKKSPIPNEMSKPYALFWKADEFAIQLTLIEHFMFQQVKPNTYLHVILETMEKKEGSYNMALKPMLEYVSWFRLISSYCASLISREEGQKKKANVIRIWIKIARECKRHNNYNTLFAIIHGLKRPAIMSLNAVWESLPSKVIEEFSLLEAITLPNDGYAAFWESWSAAKPPGIPFFAAYMHDLISLNEEVPTYIIGSEEKYYADLSRPVNMVKFYDMNRLVYELETFRGFNYPDSIVSSYESAVMFNLPLPAQPSSTHSNNSAHSTTIDYTSFVMTHIREWCILYLSEDKLLDKIVTL